MSGEFRIEVDKKFWYEFKRQLRAASDGLDDGSADLKDVIQAGAEPLADAWRRHLPGSTKGTVKIMRSLKGTVRAGFKSAHGDKPFLPWLEFGGTVKWHGHDKPYTRAPVFGFRMRKVMFIRRSRDEGGRYRRPAINESIHEVADRLGDGVQHLMNKYFS